MYHRLLIYDVKRTTKIDSMGPFKEVYDFHLTVQKPSEKCSCVCSYYASDQDLMELNGIQHSLGLGSSTPLIEVDFFTLHALMFMYSN